jgi:hypothetical protein
MGNRLNPFPFRSTHHDLPVTLGIPEQAHEIDYAQRYRRDVRQILLISETNNWTRAFGTSIANSTVLELNIGVS